MTLVPGLLVSAGVGVDATNVYFTNEAQTSDSVMKVTPE